LLGRVGSVPLIVFTKNGSVPNFCLTSPQSLISSSIFSKHSGLSSFSFFFILVGSGLSSSNLLLILEISSFNSRIPVANSKFCLLIESIALLRVPESSGSFLFTPFKARASCTSFLAIDIIAERIRFWLGSITRDLTSSFFFSNLSSKVL
jgi:hypothetical protein